MSLGKTMLGRRHVLPSVTATLAELQVEGTFTTGTYLVTIHHPIASDDGDLERALYGSFLPVPPADTFPDPDPDDYLPERMPGAVIPVKSIGVNLNEGRRRIRLKVMSKGDRPIQVCSAFNGGGEMLIIRLDRIIISSRRIPSYTLTGLKLMDIDWISRLERRFGSSREIPRQSRLWKSAGTRLSAGEISWPQGRWIWSVQTRSYHGFKQPGLHTPRSQMLIIR